MAIFVPARESWILFMPQILLFGPGLESGRWKGRVLLLKKDFEAARTDDGHLRSSSRILDSVHASNSIVWPGLGKWTMEGPCSPTKEGLRSGTNRRWPSSFQLANLGFCSCLKFYCLARAWKVDDGRAVFSY